MITLNHIQSLQYQQEISKAQNCKIAGNKGMARVCSRRAATILLKAWLDDRHIAYPVLDGYRLMLFALELPEIPEAAKESLHCLVMRVNDSYNLPTDVNLLETADRLAASLSIYVPQDGS